MHQPACVKILVIQYDPVWIPVAVSCQYLKRIVDSRLSMSLGAASVYQRVTVQLTSNFLLTFANSMFATASISFFPNRASAAVEIYVPGLHKSS